MNARVQKNVMALATHIGWSEAIDRVLSDAFDWFDTADQIQSAQLRERGVQLRQNGARRNFVGLASGDTAQADINLAIPRGSDNVVVIGASSRMRGRITINGARNLVINEGHTAYAIGALYEVRINGNSNGLLIERRVTSNGCTINVGDGSSIRIGDDCMFAHETMIYSTDMHALIDIDSRQPMATAASVVLGRHVWLGRGSMVLKGVHIGDGAVVGAKALVTKNVPAYSVTAGVPAKIVRERTTWTRKPVPLDTDIDTLLDFLAGKGSTPDSLPDT